MPPLQQPEVRRASWSSIQPLEMTAEQFLVAGPPDEDPVSLPLAASTPADSLPGSMNHDLSSIQSPISDRLGKRKAYKTSTVTLLLCV